MMMLLIVALFVCTWAQEIIPYSIDGANITIVNFLDGNNATTNELVVIDADDDDDTATLYYDDETSLTSILHENDNKFGFMIIGDWGKGGESGSTQSLQDILTETNVDKETQRQEFNTEKSESKSTNQVAVAKSMAYYAGNATIKPEFVVAVGDNFYTKGKC